MLKIISGKYKGRVIPSLKDRQYRPSTSKFREAVFSILASGEFVESGVVGKRTLDIFSGSGSLGFEALSRGAESITFIDNSAEHLHLVQKFADSIGATKQVNCLRLNALHLPKSSEKYELVFMDPPYNFDMVNKAITSLISADWLAPGAIIVAEMSSKERYHVLDAIEVRQERVYGNSKLLLLRNCKN